MKLQRRSYNDVATRGVENEPPAESFGCSAHGCPLAGSIKIDGSRVCFVHLAVKNRSDWDSATAQIRRRSNWVQAIEILRSPGLREPKMALADARRLIPALSDKHNTPYRALVAIECRLQVLATDGGADDEELPEVNLFRRFADDHRMPA